MLNTSFNRHHIPTISEPRQALEHLLDGCMDYLAISDYLVSFDENRISKEPFKNEETEDYALKRDCIKRLVTLLKIEKDKKNVIKYVKNLSKLLNVDLSFDGKIFELDGRSVKQNEIENMLLVDHNG